MSKELITIDNQQANKILMEEAGNINFYMPNIKILHREKMFVLPGDVPVKNFKGIIVTTRKVRHLWGENSDLLCRSSNGEVGIATLDDDAEEPVVRECSDCEFNKFDLNLGRKPCKEGREVIILLEGGSFPVTLLLPPTSLKAWDKFMSGVISSGKLPQKFIIEFALDEKERRGFKYSVIAPKIVQEISDDQLLNVLAMREKIIEQF